jgi:murein DD-endopeptidase MepM/ murein hydrolase activator NlpD
LRIEPPALRRHARSANPRRPLRAIAVAILGVPVLAWVYASELVRRWPAARPSLLVAVLLTGSIGLAAAPGTGARPSTSAPTVDPSAFRPIHVPATPDMARQAVGLALDGPSVVSVVPTRLPAPEVVRFRPRHGWVDVSRSSAVSVRFTRAMEHASTQQAFRVEVKGHRITGTYRWAEHDTVLVLMPTRPLPFGARIRLTMAGTARSANGLPLADARSVVFSVVRHRPSSPAPGRARTPVTDTTWHWPLIGPITQRFGESLTKYGWHNGIDIDGQTGDPVRAARDGRVIVAGHYDACGGLDVHIDHGDGFVSWYRHLSRVDVRVGVWVRTGTLIARVGNTGCSLGSHLHFGIQRRGTFVDPERYLPRR